MTVPGKLVRWLTDFRGRTSPPAFWPAALGSLGAVFVVIALGMRVFLDHFMGPEGDQPGVVIWLGLAMGGGLVTALVLLAAPVARRLRDGGSSPWLGLAPLPFATASTLAMMDAMADALVGQEPQLWVIVFLLISQMSYLGAIALLLVLLCRSSQATPPA